MTRSGCAWYLFLLLVFGLCLWLYKPTPYIPDAPELEWQSWPLIGFTMEAGWHQFGRFSLSNEGDWRLKINPPMEDTK